MSLNYQPIKINAMSLITFRPIGRLGNNMFQLSACIGYAKKYGYKWAIPIRRSAGDTFEDKPTPWLLPQFWPNLPTCYGMNGERYEQHEASMFNYKPIPKFDHDVTLVGFFQSEKWFDNAKEDVKAAFPLKHYPEYEGYVSIHVRRGDYVANDNSFPPVTMEYLKRAIDVIPFPTSGRWYNIIVFSDDIQWCKDNIAYMTGDGAKIEFHESTNEYEALSKMASCSHHIIANSTFSWFGAWLGKNPNKIVISPHVENWFGPGFTGSIPIDLIPLEWHQIKFR